MSRQSAVITCLSWLAVAGNSIPGVAEIVLWDRSDVEMIERAIEVPQTEFSRPFLIARCRDFLKNSTAPVVHLTLTTPTRTIALFQPSDSRYDSWRMYYTRELTQEFYVAELVAIRRDAVLRVHSGHEIWRIVLNGKDPLIHSVSGVSFEILYITKTPYKIVRPTRVFVRCTGRLTIDNSYQFYELLQTLLHKPIYMAVRNDPWFYNSAFPPLYWYDSTAPPDRAETVTAGAHIACEEQKRGVTPCVRVVPE